MHSSFPDWLLGTGVQPDGDTVSKRATGIAALVGSATTANATDLVRVVLGGSPRNASFDSSFTEAFRQTDAAFPGSNTFERRTLAAATIVELLEETSQASDAAALAVMTMSLQGARPIEGPVPLTELCSNYLESEALRVRTPKSATAERRRILALLDEHKAAFAEAPALPLSQAIDKTLRQVAQTLDVMAEEQERQSEETNVLWWLFSETSRDLQAHVAELAPAVAAIVLGSELAGCTRLLPVLYSSSGLLSAALKRNSQINDQPIRLVDAINALPRAWREAAPNADDSTPLFLGVKKSLETDGADDWVPVYRKAAGPLADLGLPARTLALQSYHERMLLRATVER